jgi:uncharacterized alpha-E superfamily protein
MLARHAEDLFWIGRYLERAEDTARMLDVTYHGVLEAGSERQPGELWAELLEVLFLDDEVEDPEAAGGDAVGRLLIAERAFGGSVVSLIGRARENARTTREWLSAEVWESVNELHLRLGRIDLEAAAAGQPYDVLRVVKSGCQAATGAVEASMPRGEGHRFLIIGQRLERALITSRQLRVWRRRVGGFTSPAAYAEWVKLLRSLSAYEAYLREHRASMEGGRVLQFLLQSSELPRSVLHCLGSCERMLAAMESRDYGVNARRMVGRIKAEVEFAEDGTLADAAFLERLEESVVALASGIEEDYFRPGPSILMHSFEAF